MGSRCALVRLYMMERWVCCVRLLCALVLVLVVVWWRRVCLVGLLLSGAWLVLLPAGACSVRLGVCFVHRLRCEMNLNPTSVTTLMTTIWRKSHPIWFP